MLAALFSVVWQLTDMEAPATTELPPTATSALINISGASA